MAQLCRSATLCGHERPPCYFHSCNPSLSSPACLPAYLLKLHHGSSDPFSSFVPPILSRASATLLSAYFATFYISYGPNRFLAVA